MADTASEPLRCPFCGAKAIVNDGEHGTTAAQVMCGADCEMLPATDWHNTRAEAVAVWNTRASTQPAPAFPREEVADLIDALQRIAANRPSDPDSPQRVAREALSRAALLQGKQP